MKKALNIVLLLILFVAADRCIGGLLNAGLYRYFGLNQHSQILMIGHSQLMLAVDKEELEHETGCKVSKYCREGVNVADRYAMVKQYLDSPFSDSLTTILYGVDQFMFNGKGLSANSYTLFYPFMDNADMDVYIKASASRGDYWKHKLICSTRYSDALLNSSIRGWTHNWENYKLGLLDTVALQRQIDARQQTSIHFEPELRNEFEKTLTLAEKRQIHIILVNTPVAKILNDYEPEKFEQVHAYFQSLAEQSQYVDYIDLNPEFSAQYDCFYDPIHVNPQGQKAITRWLIDVFNNRLIH